MHPHELARAAKTRRTNDLMRRTRTVAACDIQFVREAETLTHVGKRVFVSRSPLNIARVQWLERK
jgi:hypothetical protein